MADYWVEEVLFRGRPPSGPDSELPPRLQVVVGVQREDEDLLNPGKTRLMRQITDPMTMAQAKETFGYTPSGLVTEINSQAFAEVERLTAKINEQAAEIERLQASLEETSKQ